MRMIYTLPLAAAFLVPSNLAAVAQDVALMTQTSEEYGDYIADADGRALYMFEADTQGTNGTITP